MNNILRPITDDGNVGFDRYDQLVCWLQRGANRTGTIIVDVRGLTCCICNHGWESTAEGMNDQQHWQITGSWVHETCLIRHVGLNERAEFRQAMFNARTRTVKVRFEVEDIPNRYWPEGHPYAAKPWYRFDLLNFPARVIIGSRKRVAVVEVEPTEGELLWWKAAEDHFEPEAVTKEFGPARVMLHTWGEAKLKECVAKLAWFIEGSVS